VSEVDLEISEKSNKNHVVIENSMESMSSDDENYYSSVLIADDDMVQLKSLDS
jgi:hypothetical protein